MSRVQQLTEAESAGADETQRTRPLQPLFERTFIMAASTSAFTSVRTFGFLSVATALMGFSPVWAAGPVTGEFSSNDTVVTTQSTQSRAAVHRQGQAAIAADVIATGELSAVDRPHTGSSDLSRAEIRKEGQDALKAKAIANGERSI